MLYLCYIKLLFHGFFILHHIWKVNTVSITKYLGPSLGQDRITNSIRVSSGTKHKILLICTFKNSKALFLFGKQHKEHNLIQAYKEISLLPNTRNQKYFNDSLVEMMLIFTYC